MAKEKQKKKREKMAAFWILKKSISREKFDIAFLED